MEDYSVERAHVEEQIRRCYGKEKSGSEISREVTVGEFKEDIEKIGIGKTLEKYGLNDIIGDSNIELICDFLVLWEVKFGDNKELPRKVLETVIRYHNFIASSLRQSEQILQEYARKLFKSDLSKLSNKAKYLIRELLNKDEDVIRLGGYKVYFAWENSKYE